MVKKSFEQGLADEIFRASLYDDDSDRGFGFRLFRRQAAIERVVDAIDARLKANPSSEFKRILIAILKKEPFSTSGLSEEDRALVFKFRDDLVQDSELEHPVEECEISFAKRIRGRLLIVLGIPAG